MRILVIGGTGMLGHKLVQRLQPDAEVYATVRKDFEIIGRTGILERERTVTELDIMEFSKVETVVGNIRPDVVINAAGIIKQLPNSNDVVNTLTINSIFPHQLAQLCASYGSRIITFSTDCVFSGNKGNYSENDRPDAYDLYGKSKNLGEVVSGNALTIRTSIIGRELGCSHSLLEWFLSNNGGKVNGYVNAVFSGFPTIVLADIIKSLIFEHAELNGLYHVSSSPINKFELLSLIKDRMDLDIEIEPSTDLHIDRSLDSSNFRKATGWAPEPWEEMIDRMASDPTPYDKWKSN